MERSADRWARNHLSRTPPPSLPSLHASSRHGERHHFAAFSQGPKVERTKMERVRCPTFHERVSSAASDPTPLGSSSPLPFEISPTDRALRECHPLLLPLRRFTRCISGSYQLFIAHAPRDGGREASRTDPEVSPQLRGAPPRAVWNIRRRRRTREESEIGDRRRRRGRSSEGRGSGVGMKARKSLLLSVWSAAAYLTDCAVGLLRWEKYVMPLFSTDDDGDPMGWGNRGQLNPGAAEDFRLKWGTGTAAAKGRSVSPSGAISRA